MNELRPRLLAVFASGSLEELSTLLLLIHLLSTRAENHGTGPDFRDQTGSASTDEIAKSSRT
jgi:hypothetical protein